MVANTRICSPPFRAVSPCVLNLYIVADTMSRRKRRGAKEPTPVQSHL